MVVGQSASYNCSTEGNGDDPTIVWSIRTTDGTIVRSNSQLSSQIVEGSAVNDGEIKSRVTFTVLSSYTSGHRLWCKAVDITPDFPPPILFIHTSILITTTTNGKLFE